MVTGRRENIFKINNISDPIKNWKNSSKLEKSDFAPISPKTISNPLPMIKLKHHIPMKSLIGSKCFVCNELLDNRLMGEIIITLQCNTNIHEQCFIELIKDLNLCPGNYKDVPLCLCSSTCYEKYIPKDLIYFNKLLVKLSKATTFHKDPDTPTTPPNKKKIDKNSSSPNFINLSSTLIKISSNPSPNSSNVKNSNNSSPSFCNTLNSQTIIDSSINQNRKLSGNSLNDGTFTYGRLNSFTLPDDENCFFKKRPTRLSLDSRSIDMSDSSNASRPLSSTFSKFINSPLENKSEINNSPIDDMYYADNSANLRFNLHDYNPLITPKKANRATKFLKKLKKLINSPAKSNKWNHSSAKESPNSSTKASFVYSRPKDQLTLLTDTNSDTTSGNSTLNSSIYEYNRDNFESEILEPNQCLPNTEINKLNESVTKITKLPVINLDEKTRISSVFLVSTANSKTSQILEKNYISLDRLQNQFIEQLMYNNEFISFTKLTKFGQLRLVDTLIISLDEYNWHNSIVYLFENYLLLTIGDDFLEIDLDEINFSISSPVVLKLTHKGYKSVLLKANDIPIIEKWVIAISDRSYSFPPELLSSTLEVDQNLTANCDSCSIYFQEPGLDTSNEKNYSLTSPRLEIQTNVEQYNNTKNKDEKLHYVSDFDSDEELIKSIMNTMKKSKI